MLLLGGWIITISGVSSAVQINVCDFDERGDETITLSSSYAAEGSNRGFCVSPAAATVTM